MQIQPRTATARTPRSVLFFMVISSSPGLGPPSHAGRTGIDHVGAFAGPLRSNECRSLRYCAHPALGPKSTDRASSVITVLRVRGVQRSFETHHARAIGEQVVGLNAVVDRSWSLACVIARHSWPVVWP
jgi:hypothetical protein